MHLLAVAEQAVSKQLGFLPVGGSHVVFAMSLLEGLTHPHSPELADQRMLPCQPALIILYYDADDLRKGQGSYFSLPQLHLNSMKVRVQA